MLQNNLQEKKKKRNKNSPLGSGEDIFEGTELWEFSVKAFRSYSSSSSLNSSLLDGEDPPQLLSECD